MNMNILLTSAGRHTFLIERFQAALAGSGKVFVADATLGLPASQKADGVLLTLAARHPNYLSTLLSFCKQQNVSLLVPLGDPELMLLARANTQARFKAVGTTVVASSEAVIGCCLDKWVTYQYLCGQEISTPRTYLSLGAARDALHKGHLAFPVVVKSRWNSVLLSPELCYDERELELSYRRTQRRLSRTLPAGVIARKRAHPTLIQEFVGGDEYGFDVINDLQRNHVATLVRKKLGMRAGETDSAVTTDGGALGGLGEAIGKSLRHVGSLEGDAIVGDTSVWVLGLNPRLGDGYTFSHAAGANLPAVLIAWAKGEVPDETWLQAKPDITAAKYSGVMRVSPESRSLTPSAKQMTMTELGDVGQGGPGTREV